jgi:hypothetical protein
MYVTAQSIQTGDNDAAFALARLAYRFRERYRQNPPPKGVKIGRRYGVKFERRLTASLLSKPARMACTI